MLHRHWEYTPIEAHWSGTDSFEIYCYDNPPTGTGIARTHNSATVTIEYKPIVDLSADSNQPLSAPEDIPTTFWLEAGPSTEAEEESNIFIVED